MNLYNIWVSLSEMSDKDIDLFHDVFFSWFFLNVPVYFEQNELTCIDWDTQHNAKWNQLRVCNGNAKIHQNIKRCKRKKCTVNVW